MSGADRTLELSFGGRVCGVDEVGRGCLAGPVVAAAVILPAELPFALSGIADSKALTPERREALREAILASCLVGIGAASVAEIERTNILKATFLAMGRAVRALPVRPDHALIDGNRVPPGLGIPATPVVKGDATCLAVAAASIVAKVVRDRGMAKLGAVYPDYDWDENAGYGTPRHLGAIAAAGVTLHHRRTFKGVREWVRTADPVQMQLRF